MNIFLVAHITVVVEANLDAGVGSAIGVYS
jgi:hypothetical protein